MNSSIGKEVSDKLQTLLRLRTLPG